MASGHRARGAALLAALWSTCGAVAQAGSTPSEAGRAWILGISRLEPESPAEEGSPLLDIIPRLAISRLEALPSRKQPESEAAEAAALADLRSRFTAGVELAARLDARAAGFLDPPSKGTAAEAVAAADKAVAEARARLEAIGKGKEGEVPVSPARLWKGHASGDLVKAASGGLRAAAKAESIDLLVAGNLAFKEGYAIARLRAYDASLERISWTWQGACAQDDPAPLADDMAQAIERLAAGREYARIDLVLDPPSATVSADGTALPSGAGSAFVFSPGRTRLRAESAGYAPWTTSLDLALGDRISLPISLARLSLGKVNISTDPPGASIYIDSLPVGDSPVDAILDGQRRVAVAYMDGMERADAVLPPSGDASISLRLGPADGLGPGGRVAAAKDRFYRSFGWFFLSLPAATLSVGAFSAYSAAAESSGSLQSLVISRNVSAAAMAVAVGACAGLAVNAIVGLTAYIGAAK